MICKNCGTDIKDGIKFCPACGSKIELLPEENEQFLKKQPTENKCPVCAAPLKPGAKFCASCGNKVTPAQNPDEIVCSCGNKLKAGAKFCNLCGKKVESSAPSEPAAKEKTEAKMPEPVKSVPPVPDSVKAEPPAEPVKPEIKEEKNDENNRSVNIGEICSCGNVLKPGAKFCPKCGNKVGEKPKENKLQKEEPKQEKTVAADETPTIAPSAPAAVPQALTCQCGNLLKPGAKFCPKCGTKVGEKQESAAPEANADSPSQTVCSCGNTLKPGAKFCPKCGTKVGSAPSSVPTAPSVSDLPTAAAVASVSSDTPAPQIQTPAPLSSVPTGTVTAVKKPLDKKLMIIIGAAAAALVVLIVIIVIIANATPKINLSDYVEVEFSGYNGYGKLDYNFDSEKFHEDWDGKLKYNNISSDISSYYFDYTSDPANVVLSSVKYGMDFDKTSDLSNGDKVKLTWNLSATKEYLEKAVKVEIDISETEYTVADLETVGQFDPFSGFSIKYTGYDGNGHPEIENSNYQLNYIFDKTEGLKNGDTVHVTVSAPYGDDLAKYCVSNIGSVPSTTGKDFKVSGLGDMESFDPFSDIKIEFDGYSPNGKASLSNEGNYYLKYEMDKSEGLKNGDKIVVTVSAPYGDDINEYCRTEYEKKPASTKKEYTVSGLPEYVTAIADLPEAELTKMKNESEDLIKSEISSSDESISKLSFQGILLLNLKEGKADKGSYGSERNHMFYLIYLVTVKVKDYDKKTVTYSYWTYCKFNDVAKNGDGSYSVDINDIDRPYDSVSPEKVYRSYKGYKDYDDLFANVVTSKLNDYKHEADFSASQESSKPESSKQESSKQTYETSKQESSKQSSAEESKQESSKQSSSEESKEESSKQSSSEESKQESSKKTS